MLKTEELKLVYRILNNCYIKLMMPRKQSCGFIKLPFRLHQFRFFLGEQSRVPFATSMGIQSLLSSISLSYLVFY